MNSKKYKIIKGFSLIETILYIAIASILFLSLTSFVILIKNTEKDANVKLAIERDARKIFSILENYVNDSRKIDLPNSGDSDNSVRFDVLTGSKDPTTIYLTPEENLLINVNGNIEQINSDSVRVSNFTVFNQSNSSVPENIRVEFILSASTSNNQLYSENFYSSFTLRDYAN